MIHPGPDRTRTFCSGPDPKKEGWTRPGPDRKTFCYFWGLFHHFLGPFSPFFGSKPSPGPGPDPKKKPVDPDRTRPDPKQNRWTRPGPDRKTFLVDHRPLAKTPGYLCLFLLYSNIFLFISTFHMSGVCSPQVGR